MPEQQIILLAEDDEDDVLLLRTAFKEAGLTVPLQVVHDGEQAIAYLLGEAEYSDRLTYPMPVLVMLDLNMPRKTGFEVLDWIRTQPLLRRLPVLILSSSTQDGHINHAFELGANSYLVKGTNFGDLVEKIKILYSYWSRCSERPNFKDIPGGSSPVNDSRSQSRSFPLH